MGSGDDLSFFFSTLFTFVCMYACISHFHIFTFSLPFAFHDISTNYQQWIVSFFSLISSTACFNMTFQCSDFCLFS